MKTIVMAGTTLIGALMMQTPATPPVKMGLWQDDATTVMKMANMPANAPPMAPTTTHAKVCLTPESYQKALTAGATRGDCTRTNASVTSKGMTFDLSCQGGKATAHFEMTFDSMEAAHASMHMTMNMPQGAGSVDSTITMKYLSPDCGTVTPEHPVVTR